LVGSVAGVTRIRLRRCRPTARTRQSRQARKYGRLDHTHVLRPRRRPSAFICTSDDLLENYWCFRRVSSETTASLDHVRDFKTNTNDVTEKPVGFDRLLVSRSAWLFYCSITFLVPVHYGLLPFGRVRNETLRSYTRVFYYRCRVMTCRRTRVAVAKR